MALKKIFALGIGHNTPVCIDLALACDYVIEGLYHFDDSRTGEQDHGFKILGSFGVTSKSVWIRHRSSLV